MTTPGDQEFYDELVNSAESEPDTYTHEDGSEIEVVDAADLTRVHDDNGHRPTPEQAFRRLLGGA